jgi:membrane-associated phospholipid phosphatase
MQVVTALNRSQRRWLLVAAVAFLLVLALRLALKYIGPIPGDRWALHHLDQTGLGEPWRQLGFFFSSIGTPAVSVATMAVACWFVWRAAGLRAVVFVVVACGGVVVNSALKVLSGPTPLMVETYTADGLNYPSGHVVYATVAFGSLAWVAWQCRRWDISLVLIALILLMGPFRVVAETHFVSDVIAGYLVGLGWLIVAALVTGYLGRRPRGEPPTEAGPHRVSDETPSP